ncbi:MAG: hypothetical protein PHC92_07250 [Syntrophomonadaceae bacterium]|nr:hypothetical protein [Syntrophomonadaceae bacterium]
MRSVLRYYYYFEDEREQVNILINEFKTNNVTEQRGYTGKALPDDSPGIFCVHKLDNLNILVIYLSQANMDWSSYISTIDSWEAKAGLKCEELIARISILSGIDDWDKLLKEAQIKVSAKEAFLMDINEGSLARLGRFWPNDQAFYACGLRSETALNQNLLLRSLPLIEAALLKLKAVSTFLRDQKITIAKENDCLDSALSQTLHSHLVSEKGGRDEAQELELKIEELSISYGKLAGDYSTVLTGSNRIHSMIVAFNRQIKAERGLEVNAELLDEILSPYQIRLNELKELSNQLKISRENHQAAIEVVRSKIDIMNARSNITTQEEIRALMELNINMQKQSLIFQYAAGLIEFIVLAYYSHTLWSHLAHAAFVAIPSGIQFIVVMLFSSNTVYCTHLLAEYLQGDNHVKKHLILATASLAVIFTIILAASIVFSSGPSH